MTQHHFAIMSQVTAPVVSLEQPINDTKLGFGRRKQIRTKILRTVTRRLPQALRNRKTNIAWTLAVVYEDFLYKYAPDMESYSNIATLEGRVTEAARANNEIVASLLCRGS